MTQKALLTVRYRLTSPDRQFREEMAKVAPHIAKSPGLIWKIWGFDAHGGTGLSAYLFDTIVSAESFLAGPAIAGLRHHASVVEVACELAPIDDELSVCTGAAAALAARPDRPDPNDDQAVGSSAQSRPDKCGLAGRAMQAAGG